MAGKRINIFKNGSKENGKVILIPDTFEELVKNLSVKFNIPIVEIKIFNDKACEIEDLNAIRDNDDLYISMGENNFISNTNKSKRSDWIKLNVGGKLFTTSKSTLKTKEPESMLARMFAEDTSGFLFSPSNIDENGAYLIDRSSTYFEPILNYLRSGQLIYDRNVNPEGILEEARFFRIDSIIPTLEDIVSLNKLSRDKMPLTRRDVVNALISCPCSSELRFQGVNLSGADLSKLDLRNINFKYANLRGCRLLGSNLSNCCIERCDLSYALLDGAQLLGVKGLCANMECTEMKNCNFEDPCGSRSNMEGVNLKGANLEGSCMAGVNLRVATLKNANLRNCDLRAAVLAGADLEKCDLSGSDLQEANLRGANLKDASFDLMLTPLHMSQAIR